ncbi:MAG TPA: carbohydrate-binding protein [Roseiflexaceae bacterium]|nr:carbohydrate-binding protein [Roseiflexaceae bacterium]
MRRGIFLTVATLAFVLAATLGGLQVQAQSGVVRVEAESYVDFWDSTPGNAGGACRTDDVDVRQQDGSCTVGWVASGEWLEYPVTLPASGSYVIGVRSASAVAGNQLTVAVAGQSATVNVVNTGSAGSFTSYNGPSLSLPSGSHRLRITFSASAMDLNYIELRLAGPTAVPTTVPTTPPVVTPVPGGEPPLLPGPSVPQNLGPFFQLKCDTLFANNDDPIVYPGQNNAAHEHLFFGNTSTNENSTYASLLAAGTSCQEAPEDDGGYSGGQFTLGGPAGGHHALAWYQLHADFWNAWQQPALDQLVDGCLRRRQHTGGLTCNP